MKRLAGIAAAGIFLVLVIVGIAVQPDAREVSRTSFGRSPQGFGAVHEWMLALGLPAERSYAAPAELPAGATVWWLAPNLDCGPESGPGGAAAGADRDAVAGPDRDAAARAAWIEAGGTAVVFLRPEDVESACAPVAGVEIPPRVAGTGAISGALVRAPRTVPCGASLRFGATGEPGFRVLAGSEEGAFALERSMGSGRLVVLASAAFVSNDCFGAGDAPLLAGDLVRAFGAPRVDEHAHGLRAPHGAVRTLLGSPAAVFFAMALATGLLFVWCGAALPPARAAGDGVPAPTLDGFVSSLAALFAASGDHAGLLERARSLATERIARVLSLPPGASRKRVLERLRLRPGLPGAGLEALASGHRAQSRVELLREAEALDELVRSVARAPAPGVARASRAPRAGAVGAAPRKEDP